MDNSSCSKNAPSNNNQEFMSQQNEQKRVHETQTSTQQQNKNAKSEETHKNAQDNQLSDC